MIRSGLVNTRRARFEDGFPHERDAHATHDVLIRPYVQTDVYSILPKSDFAKPAYNPPNLVETKYNDIFGKTTTADERLYLLKQFTATLKQMGSAPGRPTVMPPSTTMPTAPSSRPNGSVPTPNPTLPPAPSPDGSVPTATEIIEPGMEVLADFNDELQAQIFIDNAGAPMIAKQVDEAMEKWYHPSAQTEIESYANLSVDHAFAEHRNPTGLYPLLSDEDTFPGIEPDGKRAEKVKYLVFDPTAKLPNVTHSHTQTNMEGDVINDVPVAEAGMQTDVDREVLDLKELLRKYQQYGLTPEEFGKLGEFLQNSGEDVVNLKYLLQNTETQRDAMMKYLPEIGEKITERILQLQRGIRDSKLKELGVREVQWVSNLPENVSEAQVVKAEKVNGITKPARIFTGYRDPTPSINSSSTSSSESLSSMSIDSPMSTAPARRNRNVNNLSIRTTDLPSSGSGLPPPKKRIRSSMNARIPRVRKQRHSK